MIFLKNRRRSSKSSGFSFLEISITILIIGIMISGILLSGNLISKARIKSAALLTKSSPITSINDGAMWLETALEDSFSNQNLTDGDSIANWNNQVISANKTEVTVVGTGPTYYKDSHIPTVKFSDSDANYLEISDASFLNNTDYTIVIVEKRQIGDADNYFIGSTSSNADDKLALGYSTNSLVIHAQGSNSYTSSITDYSSSDKTRIFVFTQSSTKGKKTYINGVLAAEDAENTSQLSGIVNLEIGKNYTGEILEIAIFTDALNNEKRESIENYLQKKWQLTINRDSVSGGSCINGTITNSGCSTDCTVNVAGVSSPSTLAQGETNLIATCNDLGYTGNITLSCSNGSIVTSGSCSCDIGYELSEGFCVQSSGQCSVSVVGVTSTDPVDSGSGTLACDSARYSGATINYNCINSSLQIESDCSCATGYTGQDCSSCALGGYYDFYPDDGETTCSQGCAVSGGSLPSTIYFPEGSGTLSCTALGESYTGTLSYTCASEVFSLTDGSCCVGETCQTYTEITSSW